MQVTMRNVKDTIFKSNIPTYNDGVLYLYQISQDDTKKYASEKLINLDQKIYFEELSVTDKLKFEAEERKVYIAAKIRIPQTKEIDSLSVVKIGNSFFNVYNAYHFTNKDGYKQTDLTLTKYGE